MESYFREHTKLTNNPSDTSNNGSFHEVTELHEVIFICSSFSRLDNQKYCFTKYLLEQITVSTWFAGLNL